MIWIFRIYENFLTKKGLGRRTICTSAALRTTTASQTPAEEKWELPQRIIHSHNISLWCLQSLWSESFFGAHNRYAFADSRPKRPHAGQITAHLCLSRPECVPHIEWIPSKPSFGQVEDSSNLSQKGQSSIARRRGFCWKELQCRVSQGRASQVGPIVFTCQPGGWVAMVDMPAHLPLEECAKDLMYYSSHKSGHIGTHVILATKRAMHVL